MPTPSLFDEMLTATGVTAVAARARSRLAAVVVRDRAIVLAIVLAVVAVFAVGLRNEFVQWDDHTNLVHNPLFRGLGPRQLAWMFTTTLMGHYIPLTWLTFGLDYVLWGMQPAGYHFTNLVLHAANAPLVYWLAKEPPDCGTAGCGRVCVTRRRCRGGALLRDPSPASRVGCLGNGTSRRPVGAVIPDMHVDVCPCGGRAEPRTATAPRALGCRVHTGDARQVHRHDAAAAAAGARLVSAPPAERAVMVGAQPACCPRCLPMA